MCGIFCVLQYGDSPINHQILINNLSLLDSRGPDGQNYRLIDLDNLSIFMGFTRLAIMDVSSAGMQPFELNGNVVVCNGEIYNHRELISQYNLPETDCDCAVLLPLYEAAGITKMITSDLDAEYGMLLYSKTESKLFAVRDKYGVRPLYYGYNTSTKSIGFASELKALHNIMETVYQVKPNMLYSLDLSKPFDLTNVLVEPYIDYTSLTTTMPITNLSLIQEQTRLILTRAVEKRLRSDRPIGFLLSGGLDSSLIVAIACKLIGPERMVCFTIGVDNSPDVIAAKKVAMYLGINNHHIVEFTPEIGLRYIPEVIRTIESYDVTTIRASTPQYVMAKYISVNTDIKVLLSGEGSDEIHGSYRYFRDAPDASAFNCESIRLLEDLYMFDNQRVDRTMSDNGLEVRVPFLDSTYVDFVMKIDPSILMHSKQIIEKKILRDSFAGYLPDDVLYRSKEAFSDAVSSSEVNWADSVKMHIKTCAFVFDTEYNYNPPLTLDAQYFRHIFSSYYPGRDNVLPYYWLPKFQRTTVTDPSATVLDCY